MLATQNPLEQEGTYPLPEAQFDRFLLYIKVDYPSGAEEWEIARRVTGGQLGKIAPLVSGEDIVELAGAGDPRAGERPGAGLCLGPGARHAAGHARGPRVHPPLGRLGRRPRGVLTLVTCAKARAILHGRYHATVGDVQAVVKPALRHRIAGNYAAQANNLDQRQADRHAAGSRAGRPQVSEAGRRG